MLHAHHWLMQARRDTCLARKPRLRGMPDQAISAAGRKQTVCGIIRVRI